LQEIFIPLKRQNITDNGCRRNAGNQGKPQEHMPVSPAEAQGTGYIGADMHLPPYLPYPRFLLKGSILSRKE
jgi:hypothetical protein